MENKSYLLRTLFLILRLSDSKEASLSLPWRMALDSHASFKCKKKLDIEFFNGTLIQNRQCINST